MSQAQVVALTEEEKNQIKGFNEIYTADPKAITQEQRNSIAGINEKAWLIKKDDNIPYEKRLEAFEIIRICHKILGRKFDESYKPKEGKSGNKTAFIATAEQRKKNCNEFITFLGPTLWGALNPFEQAMALANVWGAFKS